LQRGHFMKWTCASLFVIWPLLAATVAAQTPPQEPPPLWDVQIGASFIGTSGNSDTSSAGADFSLHRRWPVWQIEATATAVNSRSNGTDTAERYLAGFRGQRKLTALIGLTAGVKAEHDPLAGMDARTILDGGLSWALLHSPAWTLDGLTAIAWQHEQPKIGPVLNDAVGVFQLQSRVPLGASSDTTQRFTYYPDFSQTSAYRSEGEITAQAAMNKRLALKIGYLVRYANAPVPGFKKTDNTATASVVVRWKASTAAPAP
jgi:putative salt-induced outer membrane protein YdiY